MNQIYPVYEVNRNQRSKEKDELATTGYLEKFWIDHPQLGRSLVKLDQSTAPGWSEKIAYELAKLLNIPSARYEIGIYENRSAIVSPDYHRSQASYISGDNLIKNTLQDNRYNVNNCFQALIQNQIAAPFGYKTFEAIKDAADVFVGYLMLDDLIANNDRHGANWEVEINDRGNKYLAPVFDNGASFGCDFGSLVYDNKSPQQYTEEIVSMFGVTTNEVFQAAASIKPKAARYWKTQLEQLSSEQFQTLFERIPPGQISDKARKYALDLLNYNRAKILEIESNKSQKTSLTQTGASANRRTYLKYREQIPQKVNPNEGYFSTIVRQEKQDIAIAKLILVDSSVEKAKQILNQSDRTLSLRANDNTRAIKYVEQVITKAQKSKAASPQQENQID